MGQIRQDLPGRSGSVNGAHCTCCGGPLAATSPTTAVLRGILYDYCGDACRDRHAEAVAASAPDCEVCDIEAVGDTGRCMLHLDDEAAVAADHYPLAS